MLTEFLAGLEQLPVAAALRGSVWLYPFVNAAHIVGIALLFGSIVPLDLRLIGAWRGADVAELSRILLPVAMTGLGLAVCAGALLFITDARDYANAPFFLTKLAVIALAIANAVALRRVPAWQHRVSDPAMLGARRIRLAGAASMALWLSAIVLGRLVGYF